MILVILKLIRRHVFRMRKFYFIVGAIIISSFISNYYYKKKKGGKPEIITNGNKKITEILSKNSFVKHYEPNFLFPYGITQTILINIFGNCKFTIPILKEYVECENGDKILLEIPVTSFSKSKRILIVVPGLTSTIECYYIYDFIMRSIKKDYQIYFINHRGLGETLPNKKDYSSGDSENVKLVYDHIMKRFENPEIYSVFFVGFSMGGNLVAKMLGEQNGDSKIKGAVTISGGGIRLEECRVQISTYGFGILNRFLGLHLKKSFMKRSEWLLMDKPDDEKQQIIRKVSRSSSVNTFDDNWTAEHHGFKNLEDYYNNASSCYKLEKIKTPTLLIFSRDDPMIPYFDYYNERYNKRNQNVSYMVLNWGGHLGFFGDETLLPNPSIDRFIYDFIDNL